MNAKLMLKAPAKINIGLKVAGRRADGYHELDSVMQQISLCDTLVIRRQEEGDSFRCTEPSLEGEDNLVKRAADLLRRKVGDNLPGVRLELYKNIPMGAGLGGGSSDAAAALAGLNRFWGLNLPRTSSWNWGRSWAPMSPFASWGERPGLGAGANSWSRCRPCLFSGWCWLCLRASPFPRLMSSAPGIPAQTLFPSPLRKLRKPLAGKIPPE